MGPKRTNESMYNRGTISERGMKFHAEDGDFDEMVLQIVNHHHWNTFVRSPGDFYLDWVLEFYHNLKKDSDFSIVRGLKIDCSAEKINHLYDLDNIDDEATQNFITTPNWAVVEEDTNIFPFGVNWTYDGSGARQSLPGRNVGYVASALLAFLTTRLIPNSQNSDVYAPRVLLLYAIYNRMPVNAGRIIAVNIQACKFDPTVRSIFFPSTITLLVKEAGVKPSANLYSTLSNNMIKKSFWKKIKRTDGPKRQKGEEVRRRNHFAIQQYVLMRQISHQMETLLQSFEKMSGSEKCLGRVEESDNDFSRQDDNNQMAELVHNSTLDYHFANTMEEMGKECEFETFPEYSFSPWTNPATICVPNIFSDFDFVDQQAQLTWTPTFDPPIVHVVSNPLPTGNEINFDGLTDLANVRFTFL